MSDMKTGMVAVCLGLALAGPGLSEPLGGNVAAWELFAPEGIAVEMVGASALSPQNAALLQQVASGYAYYAAVAIAPGEDLLKSEATMLVGNHHSVESASKLALEGCEAKRTAGPACIIAALVRPERWKPRDFQLSQDATKAFDSFYGRKGVRALAISPLTGSFALGGGFRPSAKALKECAANGASDCTVVIVD